MLNLVSLEFKEGLFVYKSAIIKPTSTLNVWTLIVSLPYLSFLTFNFTLSISDFDHPKIFSWFSVYSTSGPLLIIEFNQKKKFPRCNQETKTAKVPTMSPLIRFCNSSRKVTRSTRHLRRSSVKPPGRAWAILKKSFLRKSKTMSQTHKSARRGTLVSSFTAIPWRWYSDKMGGIGRRSPWTLLDRVDYRILISTMLTASRKFQPQIGSMPAKTAKSDGTILNW